MVQTIRTELTTPTYEPASGKAVFTPSDAQIRLAEISPIKLYAQNADRMHAAENNIAPGGSLTNLESKQIKLRNLRVRLYSTITVLIVFNTERFIVEEERPALYDVSCKEYSNKIIKSQCWLEVCEAMDGDWDNLTT